MLVISQILDELTVFFGKFICVFPQRDSRGIHYRQVISKGLKELNFAILEHTVIKVEYESRLEARPCDRAPPV